MSKVCNDCGQAKSLTEFYAHPNSADGRAGCCKSCHKARMNKRRADNLEAVQAYDRERGSLAHRKQAVKERAPKYADKSYRQIATMREKYPERAAARIALGNAVRDGRVIKPTMCQECFSTKRKLQGHYHDYAKPLEVTWLCTECHGAETRKENEAKRAQIRAFKIAAE